MPPEPAAAHRDHVERAERFAGAAMSVMIESGALLYGRLSFRNAMRLARFFTWVQLRLGRARRERNLHRFFDPLGWNAADFQRFQGAYFEYMTRLGVEFGQMHSVPPAELAGRISLDGEEHLRAAQEQGRGVLLTSAHAGTWWYIPAILGARGWPVTVVFRSLPMRRAQQRMTRLGQRFGVKMAFVDTDAVKAVARALRNREIVYVAFDAVVHDRYSGWLPFGPARLRINRGPAALALRSGSPLLHASAVQLPDQRAAVTVHPALSGPAAPPVADVDALCARWLEVLAGELKVRPEQWWLWQLQDVGACDAAR